MSEETEPLSYELWCRMCGSLFQDTSLNRVYCVECRKERKRVASAKWYQLEVAKTFATTGRQKKQSLIAKAGEGKDTRVLDYSRARTIVEQIDLLDIPEGETILWWKPVDFFRDGPKQRIKPIVHTICKERPLGTWQQLLVINIVQKDPLFFTLRISDVINPLSARLATYIYNQLMRKYGKGADDKPFDLSKIKKRGLG